MNEEMPLSEDLQYWRAERPDEWIMDRFIRKAKKLELLVGQLRAKESGVEADAESWDDLEEQFSPYEWIPGGIDK